MKQDFSTSLSRTIFSAVFLYSIVIVLCFVALFAGIFYFTQEQAAEDKLLADARQAALHLDNTTEADSAKILSSQLTSDIRYTLISPDGTVVADSSGKASTNHQDRPEVQEALADGASSVARYSETLGEDTIYAAVAMPSGDVLRLSQSRISFLSFLQSMALPLIVALLVASLLSMVLTRLLTRCIVAPLDRIDISDPLSSATYKEMAPMLSRIAAQQSQLKEQNRELARAENMRREFSANVSHEMKTPLQVIAGYAELLTNPDLPREDALKFASIIRDESRHMGALIDDVLTLSRLDDPVTENAGKEEIELLDLVKETADRFDSLAYQHEVVLRVFGQSVKISGNRGLLGELVGNLISNAIRYSDHGGEVVVSVGKNVLASESDYAPEAYIKVKDSGCGIPKEDQTKIFERFYRVDKSRSREQGGTGLGLAIAKHAAIFHGAAITVESTPGEGATFTAHFPL